MRCAEVRARFHLDSFAPHPSQQPANPTSRRATYTTFRTTDDRRSTFSIVFSCTLRHHPTQKKETHVDSVYTHPNRTPSDLLLTPSRPRHPPTPHPASILISTTHRAPLSPPPSPLLPHSLTQLDKSGTPGDTAVADVNTTGAFVRKDAVFRHRIDPAGEFPPEADRYHLYYSYACPWASRCVALLGLKGLNHVFTTSSVHPTWQKTRPEDPEDTHAGWAFAGDDDVLSNPAGVGAFPAGPTRGMGGGAGRESGREQEGI